jgi:hypothetical protein
MLQPGAPALQAQPRGKASITERYWLKAGHHSLLLALLCVQHVWCMPSKVANGLRVTSPPPPHTHTHSKEIMQLLNHAVGAPSVALAAACSIDICAVRLHSVGCPDVISTLQLG